MDAIISVKYVDSENGKTEEETVYYVKGYESYFKVNEIRDEIEKSLERYNHGT